jgi:hypothetical protein
VWTVRLIMNDATRISLTTQPWMTGRWRIMNWKRCWRKQAYINFKAICLSWKFPGGTEQNHNQFESGMTVLRPRFELSTCRIGLQGTIVSTGANLLGWHGNYMRERTTYACAQAKYEEILLQVQTRWPHSKIPINTLWLTYIKNVRRRVSTGGWVSKMEIPIHYYCKIETWYT